MRSKSLPSPPELRARCESSAPFSAAGVRVCALDARGARLGVARSLAAAASAAATLPTTFAEAPSPPPAPSTVAAAALPTTLGPSAALTLYRVFRSAEPFGGIGEASAEARPERGDETERTVAPAGDDERDASTRGARFAARPPPTGVRPRIAGVFEFFSSHFTFRKRSYRMIVLHWTPA
jgi:hypothetical protein